jgi:hypothetical protein
MMSESEIKAHIAQRWNEKFPKLPTTVEHIDLDWNATSAKAEVQIGDAGNVFGRAEWITASGNGKPTLVGPYEIPSRPR